MALQCSICTHPRRIAIEKALLTRPLRVIAERFHVGKTSLWRHEKHIAERLAKSAEAREVALGGALTTEIRTLITEAHRLRKKAEHGRDYRTAIFGLNAALKALELYGKATGEIADRRVNVNVNVDIPTLAEGCQIAQELLLDGLSAEELTRFIERARERLQEHAALPPAPVIDARTVGDAPNGPV